MQNSDSEAPNKGQQVITACAFIHRYEDNQHQVFLAKRAGSKMFLPNEYELPGGHIDFGEDVKKGLAREVYEELNMKISIGDPFTSFTYLNNVKESQSIEVIYFAKFTSNVKQMRLNDYDHSEANWFSKDEIKDLATKAKPQDDDEFLSILMGFELLEGRELNKG